MFAFLRGVVAFKGAERVHLDVNGVGYELLVPAGVQRRLIVGNEATLLTYCHIREDAFTIFGFSRDEEKSLFMMLLGVSGIGPKVALAVLSGMSTNEFGRAILESDVAAFTKIGGVGKKTGQRIVLEMKAKMGQDAELSAILGEADKFDVDASGDDVVAALISLGCTVPEAKKAAEAGRKKAGKNAPDEEVVKAALQSLARL